VDLSFAGRIAGAGGSAGAGAVDGSGCAEAGRSGWATTLVVISGAFETGAGNAGAVVGEAGEC